mmetsp:Transcript_82090/g.240999  ORF Transcript_82090/g.240999 Transcript_82090/m.240999 type:complete len:81 (+) Transcript_82090:180-422(+)
MAGSPAIGIVMWVEDLSIHPTQQRPCDYELSNTRIEMPPLPKQPVGDLPALSVCMLAHYSVAHGPPCRTAEASHLVEEDI